MLYQIFTNFVVKNYSNYRRKISRCCSSDKTIDIFLFIQLFLLLIMLSFSWVLSMIDKSILSVHKSEMEELNYWRKTKRYFSFFKIQNKTKNFLNLEASLNNELNSCHRLYHSYKFHQATVTEKRISLFYAFHIYSHFLFIFRITIITVLKLIIKLQKHVNYSRNIIQFVVFFKWKSTSGIH